jgi:hypothetical protein
MTQKGQLTWPEVQSLGSAENLDSGILRDRRLDVDEKDDVQRAVWYRGHRLALH